MKPFLGVNQSLMPAHYIGSRRPVMSSVWGHPVVMSVWKLGLRARRLGRCAKRNEAMSHSV